MSDLAIIWFGFAACLVLVGLAGPALSRNADIIAARTGGIVRLAALVVRV